MLREAVTIPEYFPFTSQVEANGWHYRNCGPACLAMVLARLGRLQRPLDRETLHHIAEAVRGRRWTIGALTSMAQLRAAAEGHGLIASTVTSWSHLDEALRAKLPVVLAVRTGPLAQRTYASPTRLGQRHYIVLHAAVDTYFHVADPMERAPGLYPRADVEAAAAAVGRRLRALAFASGAAHRRSSAAAHVAR
jgi:ABC-type bacteriocin/lantibiotic exporter with double-glycine peptidase domain